MRKRQIVKSGDLTLIIGDITRQDTEAVVNAANKRLAPGGGVAGAIHRAAGPRLWEECKKLGGCETGQAKVSGGCNLPNKYVIHTVGPVYSGAESDAELLRSSYLNSLKLAEEKGIKSISFPALSTGAFGYPLKEAAQIALQAIIDYLKGKTKIELVRMVLYDKNSFDVHKELLEEKN
jgi:O-acetyl-ADP-ribose deacetylase (regulator of RNase III)